MTRSGRPVRRVGLAATAAVALLAVGAPDWSGAWRLPGSHSEVTTRVVSRRDERFDVLVQRHPEAFGMAGGRLTRPDGEARLTAARAFSIARGERQPHGGKPSVRLATFTDPDFPTPIGRGGRLAPRAVRALVWVVVVPDVPVVETGPDFGPRGPRAFCPTLTPVDATTGRPLGIWHHC